MSKWIPPSPHDLLVQVRDVIVTNPERHYQGTWVTNAFRRFFPIASIASLRPFARKEMPDVPQNPANPLCGTQACVAGWAEILGDDPAYMLDAAGGVWANGGMYVESVALRARELLGLDAEQADYLFASHRTRQEVLDYLNQLIEDQHAPAPEEEYCGDDEDDEEDE